MAHFSKLVARVTAARKEKAGIARLIAAVQAEASNPRSASTADTLTPFPNSPPSTLTLSAGILLKPIPRDGTKPMSPIEHTLLNIAYIWCIALIWMLRLVDTE
jgi:hypothetical protein